MAAKCAVDFDDLPEKFTYKGTIVSEGLEWGQESITRSLLSIIEAPNTANSFSLETLYDIADALNVIPADLINASVFPDEIINRKADKMTDE